MPGGRRSIGPEGGQRLRGRILDFGSRGPGFESLGHRSVGVSRLALALALEVGNPTHLRPLYVQSRAKVSGTTRYFRTASTRNGRLCR